jgi:hypothetical protein
MKIVLAFLLLSLPARAERIVSTALLVAAEASLIIDMLQTFDIAHKPGMYEKNPILGLHPSDGAVLVYFAVAMATTYAATQLMPERYKAVPSLFVLALQVPQIGQNFTAGLSLHLPF